MSHTLMHIFGLDNPSGPWYLFWSGVGSDVAKLAMVWGLVAHLRCAHCWRAGRHHALQAGHYVRVCRHHLGVAL